MISRARNTRSYMPTMYPEGAARSHGFGTSDRICLEGIRKRLQGLTGKEHQIVKAYEISGPGCRVSRDRQTRSNMPAYELLGRGCRISQVWNNRSNMPSRY